MAEGGVKKKSQVGLVHSKFNGGGKKGHSPWTGLLPCRLWDMELAEEYIIVITTPLEVTECCLLDLGRGCVVVPMTA